MVQAIAPPMDGDHGDDYQRLERNLIAFKAKNERGVEADWEGVLVEMIDPVESTSVAHMRVLHSDGLVRMWETKETSSVRSLHSVEYSVDEVDFKVERSIFRGGTRQANQLKGEALIGRGVEVWNEMSRSWRKAKVLKDDGEVVVHYEDNTECALNQFDVWKVEGEDTEDGILREKEETMIESVHTKCIVTHVPERGMIHVYKHLSCHEMPHLKFAKKFAWIEEDVQGADRVSTIVQLPHPVDFSKPVDAVIDEEHWLLLTYTYTSEDTAMADAR